MTTKYNDKVKKELAIFFLIAYVLPYLLGILMGLLWHGGYDTSAFPNAQMFYPAAGAMAAMLIVSGKEKSLPKKFYSCFLIITVLMLAAAIKTAILPSEEVDLLCQYIIIAGSVVFWIFLLCEKKEVRFANGLRLFKGKQSVFMVILFLVIYMLRFVIANAIDGTPEKALEPFMDPERAMILASLPISFFLSVTAFFGEEYGWRYFLQPRMQKRFGLRGGVLILGVIWGFWHLPLNLFFYSPDTALQSIVSQLITCISLGIFFAYAYMKTNNIWVPVILHYLNNNLIYFLTGSADISNQVINWQSVLALLIINAVLFVPFIFAKEFRKNATTS